MRGKVKRTDASEPQRMPLAERTQRIAALQKRLVGIRWTVDIEPSHKLQDSVGADGDRPVSCLDSVGSPHEPLLGDHCRET